MEVKIKRYKLYKSHNKDNKNFAAVYFANLENSFLRYCFFIPTPPLQPCPPSSSIPQPQKERVKSQKSERQNCRLLSFIEFHWGRGGIDLLLLVSASLYAKLG